MRVRTNTLLLTAEQEYTLGLKIANGDQEAAEALFNSNIKLANSVAVSFIKKNTPNLADDIEQTSLIALFDAAKKFDVSKGVRFSTYATTYISGEINAFLRKERGFKDPNFYSNVFLKVRRFENEFLAANGSLPTKDIVIQELGITDKQYARVQNMPEEVPLSDFQDDHSQSDDKELGLLDKIADSADFTEEIALKDIITKSLSCLNERDQLAIKMRFGLDGYSVTKIKDIEEELGYAHNSAQKNISRSLEKIKNYLSERHNVHQFGDICV